MAKLTGDNALICGDDRTIRLTFPSSIDLTGGTVNFAVKPKDSLGANDNTSALIVKSVSSHVSSTVTDIVLTDEDTRIAAGSYVFDIQLTDSNGTKTSCKRQPIQFVEDVYKG